MILCHLLNYIILNFSIILYVGGRRHEALAWATMFAPWDTARKSCQTNEHWCVYFMLGVYTFLLAPLMAPHGAQATRSRCRDDRENV